MRLFCACVQKPSLGIDPERPLSENSASETKSLRLRNAPKTGFPDRFSRSSSKSGINFGSPISLSTFGIVASKFPGNGLPAKKALLITSRPSTKYLYFVRTTEGRHTFSETRAFHNRAVAAYRRFRPLDLREVRRPSSGKAPQLGS